ISLQHTLRCRAVNLFRNRRERRCAFAHCGVHAAIPPGARVTPGSPLADLTSRGTRVKAVLAKGPSPAQRRHRPAVPDVPQGASASILWTKNAYSVRVKP